MQPNKNNSDDSSDEGDETPPIGTDLFKQLQDLLEALAEIEEDEQGERHGSGQIDRGPTRIDYDYDVSIGLGRNKDTEFPTGGFPNKGAGLEASPSPLKSSEARIHIETRQGDSGEELIIVADISGVPTEDVDVELEGENPKLTLRTNEGVVKRVELDRSNPVITDISLNNQILEVRLTRSKESNGGNQHE